MLKVNLKKLKAYGDRLDDGAIQLSFTFPVSASPEAKEAARRYVEGLGLTKVSIATMEPMGDGFCHFVAYGVAKHFLDFTKIKVPKVEMQQIDYATLKEYMERHLEKPLVVIGAATGSDAHTVGIDAIMNMKGYGGDYGLERYPLFRAINLRSQLTNQQLIDKAVELQADAILVSQVVTQRDSHIKNLKELKTLITKDKRVSKHLIVIIGGPRIDHALALKLGYDAGFGPGTKPSHVANFIVREYLKRHGIKEKAAPQTSSSAKPAFKGESRVEAKPEGEGQPHREKGHHPRSERRHDTRARQQQPPREVVSAPVEQVPVVSEPVEQEVAVSANGEVAADGAVKKKRRRRGRRGGRRHRRKREGAETTTNES